MYYDDEPDDGSTKIKIDKVPGVIALDECCWNCNTYSHKLSKQLPIDPNCEFCNGKGYRITETGEKILAFLQRWSNAGTK
jgi:hypothetical protein